MVYLFLVGYRGQLPQTFPPTLLGFFKRIESTILLKLLILVPYIAGLL